MKTYITILLFCLSINVYSQVNFFQTGAIWGYSSLEHPDTPWDPYRIWLDQYTLIGDTLINNITYKKLHDHVKETDMAGNGGGVANIIYYDYYNQYLRYDSINNKVFCYSDLNSSESLIYDFNLNVGDTVPNASFGGFIIDSIEQINIFGFSAKKLFISNICCGFDSSQYIIEGMGGSNGLIVLNANILLVSAHTITDLICFQSGNNVYPTGSTCDVFAGIGEIGNSYSFVSVFPNPFQNKFSIKISSEFKNIIFKINDVFGKNIYCKLINNNAEIYDFLKPGMFFWQAFDGDKLIDAGKIIKE